MRDWVYDNTPVTYSFVVELRDNGTYGFVVPADQICDQCAHLQ